MPPPASLRRATLLKIVAAGAIVLAGTIVVAYHVASVLHDPDLSAGFLSHGLWQRTVLALGGQIHQDVGVEVADVPIVPLAAGGGLLSILAWLGGAIWISRRRQI